MGQILGAVELPQEPAAVFAALVARDQWPSWSSSVVSVEGFSPPLDRNSRWVETRRHDGSVGEAGDNRSEVSVVAFEPPGPTGSAHLGLGLVTATDTCVFVDYYLQPRGRGGTRVEVSFEVSGGFLVRLLARLLKQVMGDEIREALLQDLRDLQAHLEA